MKIRYKILMAAIVLFFTFVFTFNATFHSAKQFSVTDSKSGEFLTVTESNNEYTVNHNGTNRSFFIDTQVIDVCCYDNTLTFLSITEATPSEYVYTITEYNLKAQGLSSYATDCKAVPSNAVFAADGCKNVYITDYSNRTLLHHYRSGAKLGTIECNSNIKDLLCVGNNEILIFSVDGVYLLCDSIPHKISDSVPVTPCSYTGNGIINDNTGAIYVYEQGSFEIFTEGTKPDNTPTTDTITDTSIIIHQDSACIEMPQGTTFAKLYKFLGIKKSELKVTKTDGNVISTGKLGTGMIAQYKKLSYTILIYGDLTGEGNINSRDLNALMDHLTQKTMLSGIFATAADLDKNGTLNTKDLLYLSKLY